VIRWEEFTLRNLHHCWLSHILRCRTWHTFANGQSLPTGAHGFVHHSLSRDPLPSVQVIADCLLILDMIIGDLPSLDDKLCSQSLSYFRAPNGPAIIQRSMPLQRIYTNLAQALSPDSSSLDQERALRVLTLITLLKDDRARDSSYALFRNIMGTVNSEPWFWHPAQLSFMGAFGWDTSLPPVGEPREILDFLKYRLDTRNPAFFRIGRPRECFVHLHSPQTRRSGGGFSRSLTFLNHHSSKDYVTLFVTMLRTSSDDPQFSSFLISTGSCSGQIRGSSRVQTMPRPWSWIGLLLWWSRWKKTQRIISRRQRSRPCSVP